MLPLEDLIVSILNRRRSRRVDDENGIDFGVDAESGRAVHWPQVRRFEHAAVLGHSGSGKTHFLEFLALQHMRRGEGFAFLDFHGDATDHLAGFAAGIQGASDRLVIIDPTDRESSPGLNPLQTISGSEAESFARSSELASILRQRWQVDAFGARTEELLRNTLFTLSQGAQTLVEAPLFLTSRTFRSRLVAGLRHPDVRSYWRDRYEPLSEAMKAGFREALLNKVTGFLTEPASRHLLGQPRSTVDLSEAMSSGRWVLINLAKGRLREHAHTLGNLLFAQLQFAVMARVDLPPSRRRLFTIFCDEAQNLAENDLMTLFAEGRKFGVSLITANQFWEQLPKELRGALLSAGTHILFRLSSGDAAVLSGELSVPLRHRYHSRLTELSRGQAIVRVGASSPSLVRIPVLPKASSTEAQEELRSLSAHLYMTPRSAVESDIRRRQQEGSRGEGFGEESVDAVDATHHDTQEGQLQW